MIYSIREKLTEPRKSSSPFRTCWNINQAKEKKRKIKEKSIGKVLVGFDNTDHPPFPVEWMRPSFEEGERRRRRRRRRRVWINSDNKGFGRSRSKPRESWFIRPLSGLSSFIQNRFRGTTAEDRSTVLEHGRGINRIFYSEAFQYGL